MFVHVVMGLVYKETRKLVWFRNVHVVLVVVRKRIFNQKTNLYFEGGMINPEDIIYKNENKFEVGMIALAWRNSEMRDCKVKIVEEDKMWYLLRDRS